MKKNCVCLICHKPNDIWFEFLSTFTKYDVYIVIDDNAKDYKKHYEKYININIIQVQNEECIKTGFMNTCYITIRKNVTGWSKALYYFSEINTEYDQVWFFEDDVFFYNEVSLTNIDSKYMKSDLLSSCYGENATGDKSYGHWKKIDINFSPPYYGAMICSVRTSKDLLSKIKDYANKHKTLFFSEALFPTICKHYNLQYDTPNELINIVYRRDYKDRDINKFNLYHPVKNMPTQKRYREMLNNNK